MATTVSTPPETRFATVADLLEQLGDVPPERVRMRPSPGTATEQDVIEVDAHEDRHCELVDGVLVEKAMGLLESFVAMNLIQALGDHLRRDPRGILAGEGGTLRLATGLVRIPDISYISWDRMPGGIPREPIPSLAPDLAVEVLSISNTRREMDRKLREYFAAGARVVWYIDPKSRTARVFTAPERVAEIGEDGELDGGDVLPGFRVALRNLFVLPERPGPG